MYSVGVDVGYSSVKIVLIDEDRNVEYSKYLLHRGKAKENLISELNYILEKYGSENIKYGSVTGSGSEFLVENFDVSFINEVAAVVEGGLAINEKVGSIIEIGGESAKYITGFSKTDKSKIQISMNSNCSAGTGSFLEDQMSRLNLKLEDYSKYSDRAQSIPRIAGRCSVFAKTDIIHHQQEGVAVPDILLGLAYALIRNYKGAVIKKMPLKKPILFAGGVAHNSGIIKAINDILDLKSGDLIIPEEFSFISALGVASISFNENRRIDLGALLNYLNNLSDECREDPSQTGLEPLNVFGQDDGLNKHNVSDFEMENGKIKCYLGVDVGSTSTNVVVLNEEKEILGHNYLRTLGDPVEAVSRGLNEVWNKFDKKLEVLGVGVTGSGRYMIGKLIGADVIKDEITAQAKAAISIDDQVDTIFEIGGQDSKYIGIEDGIVKDFQMNKICAAGTGSFVEEQSKKFDIPIEDFGDIALRSNCPINLGERCTVFIETSIASNLSRGAEIEDIASGLCYSIVKNYMARVVGQKKVGNKIFFQGGLAYNQGVVNAFRALTGKEIIVPPFFSVTGAYGAAVLTKEEFTGEKSKFKGFEKDLTEKDNQNDLEEKDSEKESQFRKSVKDIVFCDYDENFDPEKKTIGIPRALFTYGMFSMFNEIFKDLGFNVILSDLTSEKTVELGQKYSLDEMCFPVKIITGHVAELVDKKVDYIFFPDLFSVDHPGSMSRVNYGCSYMQMAFKVINRAMELEEKGIELLSPTIGFSLGKEFMMKSFSKLGDQLGKTFEETGKALQKGIDAFNRFEERMGENGEKVLKTISKDEKVFVLISKMYGVADPVLNMGIPEKLMGMGHKVVSFYDLPEGDVSKEHPNMFWPFGQHILEPAKFVRENSNFYAILLTHHGCGPDSVVSHYFREEMRGKPYLHIEVDEHSSGVGVITRIEAFINSLKNCNFSLENSDVRDADIKKSIGEVDNLKNLYLPYMYPYSNIFKEMFISKGINAKILPITDRKSVDIVRKFTITEEYFALTSLLGDVFKELKSKSDIKNENISFLIPQSEGTEAEGQYNRLLRTKLDEEGIEGIDIISPFLEDVLLYDEDTFNSISFGLLAGDIVMSSPANNRENILNIIIGLIKSGNMNIESLTNLARNVSKQVETFDFNKKILAVGETSVLYNDFLNDFTFNSLEKKGHRVLYAPLSEAFWMFWSDYASWNKSNKEIKLMMERIEQLKNNMNLISFALDAASPFEMDIDDLICRADKTVGYYSGAHGRYREAKTLGKIEGVNGIFTVASMYENTGIVMNVLHKGFIDEDSKPILNLTFDGNRNENDKTKIDSFMYYL